VAPHPFALIEQLWWAGPAAALVVGVVLGASPPSWPLLVVATGLRTGTDGERRAGSPSVLLALGAGITVVYASLGLLAGQLDRVVTDVFGAWAGAGHLVLAVALAGAGGVMLWRPAGSCRVWSSPRRGGPGAFALGLVLGVVNCPACAGIITGVAVSAGVHGGVAYRVLVMAALGVGHTAALLLVSRFSRNAFRELSANVSVTQRIGGVLLLAAAGISIARVVAAGISVGPVLP
jgi:cytochrome c-type biogenesis protein